LDAERSAQTWFPVAASTSCAVTRSRLPAFAHAAFEHITHAELASDQLHIDCAALVGKGAVARDDKKTSEFSTVRW